jgi:hypothetical protein
MKHEKRISPFDDHFGVLANEVLFAEDEERARVVGDAGQGDASCPSRQANKPLASYASAPHVLLSASLRRHGGHPAQRCHDNTVVTLL